MSFLFSGALKLGVAALDATSDRPSTQGGWLLKDTHRLIFGSGNSPSYRGNSADRNLQQHPQAEGLQVTYENIEAIKKDIHEGKYSPGSSFNLSNFRNPDQIKALLAVLRTTPIPYLGIGFYEPISNQTFRELIALLESGLCPPGFTLDLTNTQLTETQKLQLAQLISRGVCPEGFVLILDQLNPRTMPAFFNAIHAGNAPKNFQLIMNRYNVSSDVLETLEQAHDVIEKQNITIKTLYDGTIHSTDHTKEKYFLRQGLWIDGSTPVGWPIKIERAANPPKPIPVNADHRKIRADLLPILKSFRPRILYHVKRATAFIDAIKHLSPEDSLLLVKNQLACYQPSDQPRPSLPTALTEEQRGYLSGRFKRFSENPPKGYRGYHEMLKSLETKLESLGIKPSVPAPEPEAAPFVKRKQLIAFQGTVKQNAKKILTGALADKPIIDMSRLTTKNAANIIFDALNTSKTQAPQLVFAKEIPTPVFNALLAYVRSDQAPAGLILNLFKAKLTKAQILQLATLLREGKYPQNLNLTLQDPHPDGLNAMFKALKLGKGPNGLILHLHNFSITQREFNSYKDAQPAIQAQQIRIQTSGRNRATAGVDLPTEVQNMNIGETVQGPRPVAGPGPM